MLPPPPTLPQGPNQVLPDSRVLMPGDTLLTTCTYNTTGRNITATAGPGFMNETCE